MFNSVFPINIYRNSSRERHSVQSITWRLITQLCSSWCAYRTIFRSGRWTVGGKINKKKCFWLACLQPWPAALGPLGLRRKQYSCRDDQGLGAFHCCSWSYVLPLEERENLIVFQEQLCKSDAARKSRPSFIPGERRRCNVICNFRNLSSSVLDMWIGATKRKQSRISDARRQLNVTRNFRHPSLVY